MHDKPKTISKTHNSQDRCLNEVIKSLLQSLIINSTCSRLAKNFIPPLFSSRNRGTLAEKG